MKVNVKPDQSRSLLRCSWKFDGISENSNFHLESILSVWLILSYCFSMIRNLMHSFTASHFSSVWMYMMLIVNAVRTTTAQNATVNVCMR